LTIGVLYQTASATRTKLDTTADELKNTREKVTELDELLGLQKELLRKRQMTAQLGLPVELTRLVGELASVMPGSMVVRELEVKTSEQARSMDQIAGERRSKSDVVATVSRRMNVRIVGVAPTEADVTMFYARLADRRFFEETRLVRSGEKSEGELVMREFEIMFSIALDYAPTGSK
jgi:Fimbrial assembly protein (PilN)